LREEIRGILMYRNKINKPAFKWIDIDIGLKYLNENIKLYLKVLENFLVRYEHLTLESLDDEALHENVHSIKGLSSTLGMIPLAKAAERLHTNKDRSYLAPFVKAFDATIYELNQMFKLPYEEGGEAILVLESNLEAVDEVVDTLSSHFDILVALDLEGALSILDEEKIDIIITSSSFAKKVNLASVYKNFEKSSVVFMINQNEDSELFNESCYITRPFRDDEMVSCIQTQLKIINIFNK